MMGLTSEQTVGSIMTKEKEPWDVQLASEKREAGEGAEWQRGHSACVWGAQHGDEALQPRIS